MPLLCQLGAWGLLAEARGWERKARGDERERKKGGKGGDDRRKIEGRLPLLAPSPEAVRNF